MKWLSSILLIFLLLVSASPQTKISGKGGISGTAKMGGGGGGGGGCTGSLCTDLVAAWELDDLSDSTGRGNTLTNNNSATGNTGKLDNAVYVVAASAQYLSRASTSDVAHGDIDFTIAGWFYRDADATGTIIAKFQDSSGNREYDVEYNTNDSLRFYVWDSAANGTTVFWPSGLATGQWHFFIAWHDATADTINLKVNNGTTASVSTGGAIQGTGSAPMWIGGRDVSGSERYFDGRIDNIYMWKRTLTTTEMTNLWNGGAGLAHPFS